MKNSPYLDKRLRSFEEAQAEQQHKPTVTLWDEDQSSRGVAPNAPATAEEKEPGRGND